MQKVEIYQADTGGFVLVTQTKCLQISTLETVFSEVRSEFRQDSSKAELPTACPYCDSTDTIGHGLRETSGQVLTRRYCKSCKKTFVAGREAREAPTTKQQVAFLNLLGFKPKEIAETVKRSETTVRAHIENIEVADWLAKKPEEPAHGTAQTSAETAHAPKASHIPPNPLEILALPFDISKALKERIGAFTVWNHNGSLAAKEKGKQEVIYLAKDGILHMKKVRLGRQGKQKLTECLLQVPAAQRKLVGELIETLVDEDLGMFGMLRTETRVGEGEIEAEVFEEGGFVGTGGQ